jgi:hypothetical protein
MHKLAAPMAGAGLLLVVAVGAVAAASPAPSASAVATQATTVTPASTPSPVADADPIATILGLTDEEVAALRHEGLSLAQIAERQKVDPQRLIDALVAQWSVRIDARLAVGAITADQAETLRANLGVQAKAMVNQTALGGMRGAAVGAGPNGAGNGAGRGAGAGGALRDGTGAAGGRGPGARMGANTDGAGRGGMMRGAGNGTGICPMADTAPSS